MSQEEFQKQADMVQNLAQDAMIYLLDLVRMRGILHAEYSVMAVSLMMSTGVHALKSVGPIHPALAAMLRRQLTECLDELK